MQTTAHTNVDPAELAKFSDLAHRWWDPESEFRPLHQINPLRLDWINGIAPGVIDNGVAGKLAIDPKQDDFTENGMDISVFADAAGNVGTFTTSE